MDESIFNLNEIRWSGEPEERVIDLENVDEAYIKLSSNRILNEYIDSLVEIIITIDWRTPSAPFDNADERRNQLIYKGSGGYTEYYNTIKDSVKNANNELLNNVINKMN